jgi:hypothetical protein
VRAPNVRLTTRRAEPLLTKVRERFHAWVDRHIVADDPYDSEDLPQVGTDERSPNWTRLSLALMVLSAVISIIGLSMLWAWLTD